MPYSARNANEGRQRLIQAILHGFNPDAPLHGPAPVSSPYGMRVHPVTGQYKLHNGIDFAVEPGTPVYAADDGYVSAANRDDVRGNNVSLQHAGGNETRYEHLSRFSPQALKGGWFKKGDLVGYSGSTGRSTGPHLHYGMFNNGTPMRPAGV